MNWINIADGFLPAFVFKELTFTWYFMASRHGLFTACLFIVYVATKSNVGLAEPQSEQPNDLSILVHKGHQYHLTKFAVFDARNNRSELPGILTNPMPEANEITDIILSSTYKDTIITFRHKSHNDDIAPKR